MREFLAIIAGILIISTVVFSAIFSLGVREMIGHSLVSKGNGLAAYIAKLSIDPLIIKDYLQLDSLVNEANKDEDIIYIIIQDAHGDIVTSQYSSINYRSPRFTAILSGLSKDSELQDIIAAVKKKVAFTELSVPILTGIDTIGKVTVGISQEKIHQQMIKTILFVIALNAGLAFTLGFVLFVASKKIIITPIIELANAAGRLAKGDLTTQVKVESTGEVRMLMDSFNQMAANLEKTTVSRDYVDDIIGSMRDTLIVTSRDGTITRMNMAACFLLGYDETELLGRPISRVLLDEPGEDMPLLSRVLNYSSINAIERTYLAKSGKKVSVLFSASVMRDADGEVRSIVCMAQDMTERKRYEEELKRSNEFSKTILDSMNDAISIINTDDMRIVAVNKGFLAEFGLRGEDVIGKTCHEITHHRPEVCEPPDDPCPLLNTVETGEHSVEEHVHFDCHDKKLYVEVSTSPIKDAAGKVIQVVHVGRNISERKDAEKRLKNYSEELEQINEELKNFAYIISHDLRAPLVNIRGFSDELNRGIRELGPLLDKLVRESPEQEQRKYSEVLKKDIPDALTFIRSSVNRMDSLINAVLELSRVGRRKLTPEPVLVKDLVQTVVNSLAHQIGTRNITMMVRDLPDVVTDRTALEQIFGNLLDNAIKYLDTGRVGEVEVSAERNGPEIVYHVRDNGRGMAKEDIPRAFEIFRRVGKQDVPGEGMGLAYVKTIVRLLGGRIWCKSEVGAGTTFSFALPSHSADFGGHVSTGGRV